MEENIIEFFEKDEARGYTYEEINEYFSAYPNNDLEEAISALEGKGLIFFTKKRKYFLVKTLNYQTGIVRVNKKGLVFVNALDEDNTSYKVKNDYNIYNGDRVLFQPGSGLVQGEARIINVLERGIKRIVGEVVMRKSRLYVSSDDQTIDHFIVIDEKPNYCVQGHKVVMEKLKFHFDGHISGEITKILGYATDPGMDILSIAYKHGFSNRDFLEAEVELEEVINRIDYSNRVDLTNKKIITIDGIDAKDLDDAVCLERLENGNYLLGVHIADVSYYVKENSVLDQIAYEHATSVYLADRVIPMLPQLLSNDICSLNSESKKLTISCDMEIDNRGEVVNYEIYQSFIHTAYRMNYDDVNEIIENENKELINKYRDIVDMLKDMKDLESILNKKRLARGALEFETKEVKAIFGKKNKIIDIVLKERKTSENIIEEFMILANETVASAIFHLEMPFIYRIHESPNPRKLKKFLTFIKILKYRVSGGATLVYATQLQDILEQSKGKEESTVISTLMLRCMQKARYSDQNLGHFGLASKCYTHFTSPIRRYPDLIVHRLLRKYLFEKKIDEGTASHYSALLPTQADHCTAMEINAVECERDVMAMVKAKYMERHIGKNFPGIISGVTTFGIFVELENGVEGLVHISELPYYDNYIYNELEYSLVGKFSNTVFRIGDKVEIKVKAANKKTATIDFVLITDSKSKPKNRRSRR